MTGQDETQGQIRCMPDTDADRDKRLLRWAAVVAELKDGRGGSEIETVMRGSSESQCLTESAGAGGQQAVRRLRVKTAICRHQVQAHHWFERPEEDRACEALGFTADVHAEMHAIDSVEVGVPGGAEEDGVARGRSAMGVRGPVRRIVVGAKVSLYFHDAPGDDAVRRPMYQQLAEQCGSDPFRRLLKEATWKETAREANRRASRYLCALFHSLMRATTSSA